MTSEIRDMLRQLQKLCEFVLMQYEGQEQEHQGKISGLEQEVSSTLMIY